MVIIHGIKFEGTGNSAADGDVKLKTLVVIAGVWNNPVFSVRWMWIENFVIVSSLVL